MDQASNHHDVRYARNDRANESRHHHANESRHHHHANESRHAQRTSQDLVKDLERQLKEAKARSYSHVVQTPTSMRDTTTHLNDSETDDIQRYREEQQQTKQLEISEVLNYINTAMQTLNDFGTRLKKQNNSTMTPSGTSSI